MDEYIHHEDSMESTKRLEAFSDGVFAIAITLLILEIKVPSKEMLEHERLSNYLLRQWPEYFAYIFSFVIIGIYWANHQHLFRLFRKSDHVFNLLNIFFLMTIAFLPYPTGIFGEYITDKKQIETAVLFYSVGIFLPALAWLLMWLYGSANKRLLDHRLKESFINGLTRKFILSNLLYIIAILLALWNPFASITLNVGLTLLYLIPPPSPQYHSQPQSGKT